ncbi:hypothetical protein HY251_00400 [bacterium]|nr:hypothetical protein [bacterium]
MSSVAFPRLSRVPRAGLRAIVAASALAFVFAAAALAESGLGATAIDSLTLRLSREPERRARSLGRLAAGGAWEVLERTIAEERDGRVLERALELAAGRSRAAAAIAARLESETAGSPAALVLLRAAAAQADERALEPAKRILRDPRSARATRGAAFTAIAAIAARRGLGASAFPRLRASEVKIVSELAWWLEEDAPAWRTDGLRALAQRTALGREHVFSLRTRLAALDARSLAGERLEAEEADRAGLLSFLLLRGDPDALARCPEEQRERLGLLAPGEVLARARPGDLDLLLQLDRWGGTGSWRALEAVTGSPGGREALAAALERTFEPTHGTAPADLGAVERLSGRPALVAALVPLARSGDPRARELLRAVRGARPGSDRLALWARAGLGEIALDDPASLERLAEEGTLTLLPPPLVADALQKLGPRAVPGLVRASGGESGELARILEPGAGTERERSLLDLAVAALCPKRERP